MPDKTARLFYQIINENFVLAQKLSIQLKAERACIAKRDFNGHQKILDEKTECVKGLAQAEQHLILLFKKMGIEDYDSAKIDALILNCPPSHRSLISSGWKSLKAELSQCKQLNSINGRIIHHSKGHIDRLLSIIKGQDHRATLYQADGHSQHQAATRSLARA
ncbi:MAG: flagellar protein FlgN [Pseudomonadales bacterium]|nr:flagellar protein FlgN [Pseudomonadales bacterium]